MASRASWYLKQYPTLKFGSICALQPINFLLILPTLFYILPSITEREGHGSAGVTNGKYPLETEGCSSYSQVRGLMGFGDAAKT